MRAGRSDEPETIDAAAWRRAWRDSAPPAAGCPGETTLAALAAGQLAGDERLAAADHVVACPACAESYRLLRELHAEAAPALREARATARAERRRPRRRWWAAGAAAAAAAAIVAVATWPSAPLGPSAPDALRGAAATELVLDPPHGAVLATPPERLAWSGGPRAVAYRVWVYDAEAAPLWSSEPTEAGRVELPAELRRRLDAGGTFYWRVRTDDGPARRATPMARFEIAR